MSEPELKMSQPSSDDLRAWQITRNDPKSIGPRLYDQVSVLLDQLEKDKEVTIRERIAALSAIGRLQLTFAALRAKEGLYDPQRGSSVRKYASAFKANGSGRRKKIAGPASPDDTVIDSIWPDDDSSDSDAAILNAIARDTTSSSK